MAQTVKAKQADTKDPGSLKQHIVLIYNPHSNGLLSYAKQEDAETYLRGLLDPLELDYELIALNDDTLDGLPERLVSGQTDAVWVAGGDGSVLALAEITRELGLPLGVIPAGTMNLLARDLGMSLDLAEAVQQLASAELDYMDRAEVCGHPFLCIANIGLQTRFTQLREEKRHDSALTRWPVIAWKMLRSLFDYPMLRIEIVANGRTTRIKSRSLSVSDNPLSDEGGLLPARKRLDSGELAIYVTKERSAWSLPRLYAHMVRGNWHQDPDLLVIRTKDAIVRFPKRSKIRLMCDGEMLKLPTPLRFQVHPRSLPILRPVKQEVLP